MLGIAKVPFPATISIRQQNESFLVFDDLLALSRVHLNVIPTREYLPDFLSLLKSPQTSEHLISAMFEQVKICFLLFLEF